MMKSGSRGEDDDESEDGYESRPEIPRPPLKGEHPAGEFDDFNEEDFDDEFDDDFEEELEDEYELSEFGELTVEDLAEDDEEADVTALGDFVDEDAEPEEEPLEEAPAEAAPEEAPAPKAKKKGKGKGKRAKDEEDEDGLEDDE